MTEDVAGYQHLLRGVATDGRRGDVAEQVRMNPEAESGLCAAAHNVINAVGRERRPVHESEAGP